MNTFYLDMDGVVADFDKAAMIYVGYDRDPRSHKWKLEDWIKIRNNKRWFKDLPKTAWADELVDLARQFRDKCGWDLAFLTAIPSGNDFPYAFYDKIVWVQNHYPEIPVMFGPYSKDKRVHCSPGDILVDDRLDNCQAWTEAGGISVRLPYRKNPQEAIEMVKMLLEEQIKNMKH